MLHRRQMNLMSDWSPWFRLVLAILATWRVAHLVAREDGPFEIIVRLRARVGNGVLGALMDCPYCLSMWVAIPFAFLLGQGLAAWLTAWLAISGGASLCERLTEQPDAPIYFIPPPTTGE